MGVHTPVDTSAIPIHWSYAIANNFWVRRYFQCHHLSYRYHCSPLEPPKLLPDNLIWYLASSAMTPEPDASHVTVLLTTRRQTQVVIEKNKICIFGLRRVLHLFICYIQIYFAIVLNDDNGAHIIQHGNFVGSYDRTYCFCFISALLALCADNSTATCEFPTQRLLTRNFDVFFDLHLNKRASKQSWGYWSETPPCSLWRHRNGLHGLVIDQKCVRRKIMARIMQSWMCLRNRFDFQKPYKDLSFIHALILIPVMPILHS